MQPPDDRLPATLVERARSLFVNLRHDNPLLRDELV
jgi:hypothetical protein